MDLTTQHKLDTLTMEPSDWRKLEAEMNNPNHDSKFHEWTPEYRKIVLDYQRREEEARPTCDTLFGTCRYCGFGFKCGYKGHCKNQRKAA